MVKTFFHNSSFSSVCQYVLTVPFLSPLSNITKYCVREQKNRRISFLLPARKTRDGTNYSKNRTTFAVEHVWGTNNFHDTHQKPSLTPADKMLVDNAPENSGRGGTSPELTLLGRKPAGDEGHSPCVSDRQIAESLIFQIPETPQYIHRLHPAAPRRKYGTQYAFAPHLGTVEPLARHAASPLVS